MRKYFSLSCCRRIMMTWSSKNYDVLTGVFFKQGEYFFFKCCSQRFRPANNDAEIIFRINILTSFKPRQRTDELSIFRQRVFMRQVAREVFFPGIIRNPAVIKFPDDLK